MAYVCHLGSGQTIYLENQGEHTSITSMQSTPGQQQQSSSRFTTGAWVEAPQVWRSPQGTFIKVMTHHNEVWIQVQGQNFQVTSKVQGLAHAQQMQVSQADSLPKMGTPMQPMDPMKPIEPMQPMEPMKPMESMKPMEMGGMRMDSNSMQMQMGDMQMQMGKSPHDNQEASASKSGGTQRRFCTQCGQPVAPEDRFCGACGHALAR